MAYFSPFIDETGLHTPIYSDVRDELISEMKQIFGDDIYLDSDSMDYQQISIFARKIYDVYNLAQLIYNNRTPITAIGTGLDNDVVFGGIKRKPATYSTVQLTIVGNPSSVIKNGQASDGTNIWDLPAEVVIPDSGTITVEAKCDKAGNIGALPNTINTILTPVYGWYSVTNNYIASPGVDQETDAELRARFGISTHGPSTTVFDSIQSGIEAVSGVQRVKGYENDTSATSTGTVPTGIPADLPPHSVTFVVEGGDDHEVATALWVKKTPGCYTNGTTTVEIVSVAGNINNIRFYRPTYKNIQIKVTLKKLSTYNDEYATKIKNAVSEYVMGMELGDTLYRSIIWSVATSTMESIGNPAFSVTNIQFSTDGTNWSTDDISLNFYEASYTTVDMVTVEVS